MSEVFLKRLLSKAFGHEWALAYRSKRNGEILYAERQCFTLINNSLRYWCADPFLAEEAGKTYIFFEAYDRLKRKGVIGYRKIDGDQTGKLNIVIEEPFHMSYPYIYKEDGSWFMIPETKDINRIVRYRAINFPGLWERDKVLADNIPAVDSTVFSCKDGCMELFTYLYESFNKGELQLLQITEENKCIRYRYADLDGKKRPAGKCCRIGSYCFRPSQFCTKSYGEAIIFNKIQCLDSDSYEETESRRITTAEISLDRFLSITGTHTYNSSENWEAIDVEIRRFSILRILCLMPRLYREAIKRLGRKETWIERR
jgi:hypothetical protein